MEQGQTPTGFNNRPRLRMAAMRLPEETARRRMVRQALEEAGLTQVSARHVEALVRRDYTDTFDWPTRWQLGRMLPGLVRQVEADPARAEQLAVGYGLA
jgi:hypothetical protein